MFLPAGPKEAACGRTSWRRQDIRLPWWHCSQAHPVCRVSLVQRKIDIFGQCVGGEQGRKISLSPSCGRVQRSFIASSKMATTNRSGGSHPSVRTLLSSLIARFEGLPWFSANLVASRARPFNPAKSKRGRSLPAGAVCHLAGSCFRRPMRATQASAIRCEAAYELVPLEIPALLSDACADVPFAKSQPRHPKPSQASSTSIRIAEGPG